MPSQPSMLIQAAPLLQEPRGLCELGDGSIAVADTRLGHIVRLAVFDRDGTDPSTPAGTPQPSLAFAFPNTNHSLHTLSLSSLLQHIHSTPSNSVPSSPALPHLMSTAGGTHDALHHLHPPHYATLDNASLPPPQVCSVTSAANTHLACNATVLVSGLLGPVGIAALGSDLVICESDGHHVRRISLTGHAHWSVGERGGGPDQYSHPAGIAVGSDMVIVIADAGNHRLARLGPDGEHLDGIGGAQMLHAPAAVAVTRSGNYIVADRAANRVQASNDKK